MPYSQELLDYVKRQLEHGHEPKVLREHLINHGHQPALADEVLKAAGVAEKAFAATTSRFLFSGKAIALVVLGLVVLGGLGFGSYQLFFVEDIAGSATEPVLEEFPAISEEREEVSEEASIVEEETVPEESVEAVEEEIVEEEGAGEELEEEAAEEREEEEMEGAEAEAAEEIILAGSCSSNSDCVAWETCYESLCQTDTDRDQLPDAVETTEKTDIHKQDSDDDGVSDYDEVKKGTDPIDATKPGYVSCNNDADCVGEGTCSAAGVCIACSDSDAKNDKKRGITKGVHYISRAFIVSQDSCTSIGKLMEYYCRSDNSLFYKEVDCATAFGEGYNCDAGVCAKQE